jgi:hypothetical protein
MGAAVGLSSRQFRMSDLVPSVGILGFLRNPMPTPVAPIGCFALAFRLRTQHPKKRSARDTLGVAREKVFKVVPDWGSKDEVSSTNARNANPKFAIEQRLDTKGDE